MVLQGYHEDLNHALHLTHHCGENSSELTGCDYKRGEIYLNALAIKPVSSRLYQIT